MAGTARGGPRAPDGWIDTELLVTSASDELTRSLAELRELARGIHPAALDNGLDIALEALAMRSAVPTTVTVEPGPVLPEPVVILDAICPPRSTASTTTTCSKHWTGSPPVRHRPRRRWARLPAPAVSDRSRRSVRRSRDRLADIKVRVDAVDVAEAADIDAAAEDAAEDADADADATAAEDSRTAAYVSLLAARDGS